MRRREFLALAGSAALLTGCPVSFEQGLFNECREPTLSAAAKTLLDAAWQGIQAENVWDMHAHLFGNGRSGSGIYLNERLDHPMSPAWRVRRAFFLNAGCIPNDDAQIDAAMVTRLVNLARTLGGAKVMLLAFDYTRDEAGQPLKDETMFAVPDAYARKVAAAHPALFEWIASIHPYRSDAVAALEEAKRGGARAVKWLPSAMHIDLASPRCRPFYEALQRLDIPLLVHVGDEQAVAGSLQQDLGNPMRLRHPLDAGVRVIAAHCGTLGKSDGIDNFELFTRLMAEPRYEKLLFGDISAITQINRMMHIPAILQRREWHARLLNGSDYPLPGILPIFSLKSLVSAGLLDEAVVPPLKELRDSNPLAFDFALKRNLRYGSATLSPGIFETRSFFR